jgi:4-carboxymuconolactone decarboxylase
MPAIADADMTAEQKAVMDEIAAGPRGRIGGPFIPLMRSPELMNRVQKVGEYLRFHNTVGLRNSEFAVLIVARHWGQPIEWAIHRTIAEREGVLPATCDAIAQGRRPDNMTADEALIHDTLEELRSNRCLSDVTYERVRQRFGEQGVIVPSSSRSQLNSIWLALTLKSSVAPQKASLQVDLMRVRQAPLMYCARRMSCTIQAIAVRRSCVRWLSCKAMR